MEFFRKQTNIDFMGKRRVALVVSAVLMLISAVSLVTRGLNFGLDFTGGTLIEVSYEQPPELNDVRASLSSAGFGDAVVQTFGEPTDIVVRLAVREPESSADDSVETDGSDEQSAADSFAEQIGAEVLTALQEGTAGEVTLRRQEYVGPQIGRELAEKGALAMLVVLLGILAYVSLRFQWRFSLGAVAALVHDVLITFGVLSLVQLSFDLTVVAALLAVIGYSLNDTIVVFDRIRENFRTLRKQTAKQVVNTSVNQTLSRTLMTSGTTLLVLIALFYFGGEIIHAFAFTLIAGVLVGTYSSIYVASNAILSLGVSREDLLENKVEKEGAHMESLP